MFALFPEDRNHQIGRAIDDGRDVGIVLGDVDETAEADAAGYAVERSHRLPGLGQYVDGALARRGLAGFVECVVP